MTTHDYVRHQLVEGTKATPLTWSCFEDKLELQAVEARKKAGLRDHTVVRVHGSHVLTSSFTLILYSQSPPFQKRPLPTSLPQKSKPAEFPVDPKISEETLNYLAALGRYGWWSVCRMYPTDVTKYKHNLLNEVSSLYDEIGRNIINHFWGIFAVILVHTENVLTGRRHLLYDGQPFPRLYYLQGTSRTVRIHGSSFGSKHFWPFKQ